MVHSTQLYYCIVYCETEAMMKHVSYFDIVLLDLPFFSFDTE